MSIDKRNDIINEYVEFEILKENLLDQIKRKIDVSYLIFLIKITKKTTNSKIKYIPCILIAKSNNDSNNSDEQNNITLFCKFFFDIKFKNLLINPYQNFQCQNFIINFELFFQQLNKKYDTKILNYEDFMNNIFIYTFENYFCSTKKKPMINVCGFDNFDKYQMITTNYKQFIKSIFKINETDLLINSDFIISRLIQSIPNMQRHYPLPIIENYFQINSIFISPILWESEKKDKSFEIAKSLFNINNSTCNFSSSDRLLNLPILNNKFEKNFIDLELKNYYYIKTNKLFKFDFQFKNFPKKSKYVINITKNNNNTTQQQSSLKISNCDKIIVVSIYNSLAFLTWNPFEDSNLNQKNFDTISDVIYLKETDELTFHGSVRNRLEDKSILGSLGIVFNESNEHFNLSHLLILNDIRMLKGLPMKKKLVEFWNIKNEIFLKDYGKTLEKFQPLNLLQVLKDLCCKVITDNLKIIQSPFLLTPMVIIQLKVYYNSITFEVSPRILILIYNLLYIKIKYKLTY